MKQRELEVICDECGNNTGFIIRRKGEKDNVDWDSLSRDEQLRVLNLLATGYDLLKRYLNEE